jgi:predicted HicB family RNase H-like nuclease
MPTEYWHIRVTIESSAKQRLREQAAAEHRSLSNYVSRIIEQKIRETSDGRPA